MDISLFPEFIDVGKPACALDTLYEVFRNKKWAYNNMNEGILEPIMFKYLDLCVELRKSHIAKEGLFQYRNLFQSVSKTIFSVDCNLISIFSEQRSCSLRTVIARSWSMNSRLYRHIL